MMDKPDRPPSSNATPDEPSALAAPEVPTVVEASDARTERIAFMRHELAELQRQLIDAQRRVATELEGRAEDADRIEELEARLQAQEVKAREDAARIAELADESSGLRVRLESAGRTAEQLRRELEASKARVEESDSKCGELARDLEEQVSSLRDTKTLLAARDEEVATTLAERDAERAARARLEGELQAALGKHGELGEELESSHASLTAVKKLLSESEAELAAMTLERDAQQETRLQVEDDLDKTRRTLEAGRARVQQLAEQISSSSARRWSTRR
jgi:chromosome segregation ATPase